MVSIYIMNAGQKLNLKGKATGFYLYRDLMGKIEMDFINSDGGTVSPMSAARWVAMVNEEVTEKEDGKKEAVTRRKPRS